MVVKYVSNRDFLKKSGITLSNGAISSATKRVCSEAIKQSVETLKPGSTAVLQRAVKTARRWGFSLNRESGKKAGNCGVKCFLPAQPEAFMAKESWCVNMRSRRRH